MNQPSDRKRILLTNDDGIRSPALLALHDALVGADDRFAGPLVESHDTTTRSPRSVVLAVAPKTVQSATSHGVTFHEPLMVEEEPLRGGPGGTGGGMAGVAVDGRPADCVKLALCELWPARFGAGALPDLVISGMNVGANVGIHVIYSGTVAAALEAAFLGVPSIAVSLQIGQGRPDFAVAARFARQAIERAISAGLPRPHECLNVNVPVTERDGPCPEIRVCPMNVHGAVDRFERRTSPRGDVYYWMAGDGDRFHGTDAGSDVDLLQRGFVTITPLGYDLTSHAGLARWRERLDAGALRT